MSVGMGWVRRNAAPLRSRFCLGGAGGLGAGRSSSFALLRFLLRGGFVLLLQVWIVGAGRMVRHVLAMFGFAGSGDGGLGACWVLISGLFSSVFPCGTSCFSCDELLWLGLVCWPIAVPGVQARVAPRAAVIKWFMNLGRFIASLQDGPRR